MPTGKGAQEFGLVRIAIHRKCSQVEADNPALGARRQQLQLRWRKVQPHPIIEEERGLAVGKTQIIGADFGQLAVRTQAPQR